MRLLALVIALALAGCAAPADKPPLPTQDATEDPTPVVGTKPTTTTAPPPQTEDLAIAIADFSYNPGERRIAVGSNVTWTNQDTAPHTVTADDAQFDSGRLASGASYSRVFDAAGTFAYHCAIHPSMKGTLVVG